jgi:hypothetical protein
MADFVQLGQIPTQGEQKRAKIRHFYDQQKTHLASGSA